MDQNNQDTNNILWNGAGGGYPDGGSRKRGGNGLLSKIPSLFFPAIILLGFSWVLHTLATFIPYWSTFRGVSHSRAGLWSARANSTMIQNFYFPPASPQIQNLIKYSFTSASTKAYIVTVQFLMTFNFVFMLIVLVLLFMDLIFYERMGRDSFLQGEQNSSETTLKYGLLLYIIYVFGVFEWAAWITYVGSRHDNRWHMHVSFAFTVIVSIFLIVLIFMFIIEFLKRFTLNRKNWTNWYGQWTEWGLFIFLTALLFLLIAICCPEWAYARSNSHHTFAEGGLFKQCNMTTVYKRKPSPTTQCTLSNSSSNRSWINTAQAFFLIAYIVGILLLIAMVIFRKSFQHDETGYRTAVEERFKVPQPLFSYIVAGIMIGICFLFSLIGVSVFGSFIFDKTGYRANWAFLIVIFAMILFLIAGIMFILDAVHSYRQALNSASGIEKFFFPAPLNQRVQSMAPLIPPQFPPTMMGPSTTPGLTIPNGSTNVASSGFPQFNDAGSRSFQLLPVNNTGAAPVTQAPFGNYFNGGADFGPNAHLDEYQSNNQPVPNDYTYPKTGGGNAYPQANGDNAYPHTGGNAYPQANGDNAYPHTGGNAYPQADGGNAYPHTGGNAYPKADGGNAYPHTEGDNAHSYTDGSAYPQTDGGNALPNNSSRGFGPPVPFTSTKKGNVRETVPVIELLRRHFVQQQRLNYNHERLLERFQQMKTPLPSEFRTYGVSTLPGRNYDRWINTNRLSQLSRPPSGTSSETYRYLGEAGGPAWANEPFYGEQEGSANSGFGRYTRNVSSIMQNRAQDSQTVGSYQPADIHDESSGSIPNYIRPVFSQKKSNLDDNDQSDEEKSNETRSPPPGVKKGYISYPAWKRKYQDVIPVNPFLYNVRTSRPNSTYNLYNGSHGLSTATPTYEGRNASSVSIDSTSTEVQKLTKNQPYHHLQQSDAENGQTKVDDTHKPYRRDTLELIESARDNGPIVDSPPDSPIRNRRKGSDSQSINFNKLSPTVTTHSRTDPVFPRTQPVSSKTNPTSSQTPSVSTQKPNLAVAESDQSSIKDTADNIALTANTSDEFLSTPKSTIPNAPPLPSKGSDDISSESGSDDEENKKRKERRKRAAEGLSVHRNSDESSSDDDTKNEPKTMQEKQAQLARLY
ncbi:unnamed protein product [Didymodactylos carnosus]|uniref:Uncharacterized protein n=1 Tax=Didymodactylos carnosus TaxID=1234261 RepID=A0A8S2ICV5_9BILA|nr:unnamed protein product [Didymodactylos carnosus]CAF3744450.1 unnamed protein product [Didymodactylos carnosus]